MALGDPPYLNYETMTRRSRYPAEPIETYVSPPQTQAVPSADPWKHRSQGMRCKSCMWFVPKEPPPATQMHPGQFDLGRCRKHAPTMGGFPVVFVNDWCGDHRIDENKV